MKIGVMTPDKERQLEDIDRAYQRVLMLIETMSMTAGADKKQLELARKFCKASQMGCICAFSKKLRSVK